MNDQADRDIQERGTEIEVSAGQRDGSGLGKALVVLAAPVASCAVLYDLAAAAWVCDQDTSYCAFSHDEDGFYAGTLRASDGAALADRQFSFVVVSRRGLDPLMFRSDVGGRICVRWPQERVVPLAQAGTAVTELRDWTPVTQARPPTGCRAGNVDIPWNRADDLTSQWQFLAVLGLALLSLSTLLGGVVARSGRRRPPLRLIGVLTAFASVVLCAAVWQ